MRPRKNKKRFKREPRSKAELRVKHKQDEKQILTLAVGLEVMRRAKNRRKK